MNRGVNISILFALDSDQLPIFILVTTSTMKTTHSPDGQQLLPTHTQNTRDNKATLAGVKEVIQCSENENMRKLK